MVKCKSDVSDSDVVADSFTWQECAFGVIIKQRDHLKWFILPDHMNISLAERNESAAVWFYSLFDKINSISG